MSRVVWGRGGAGQQGTKGCCPPPPPSKFIGGGSWPPLPTLMHTEIKLQILDKYMYMVTERGGGGKRVFCSPPPPKLIGGTLKLDYKLLQIHIY